MKLIDILVQGLPKVGGWPREVDALVQSSKGAVYKAGGGFPVMFTYLADDWELAEVTREQYEAALAFAQHSVWSGEGLPPIGCECEIKRIADWMPVTIKFISEHHTVFTTFGGTEDCYQTCSLQFRAIRSEEDRKRDAACDAMHKRWREVAGQERRDGSLIDIYSCIYDAIVAGKIPHIQLK